MRGLKWAKSPSGEIIETPDQPRTSPRGASQRSSSYFSHVDNALGSPPQGPRVRQTRSSTRARLRLSERAAGPGSTVLTGRQSVRQYECGTVKYNRTRNAPLGFRGAAISSNRNRCSESRILGPPSVGRPRTIRESPPVPERESSSQCPTPPPPPPPPPTRDQRGAWPPDDRGLGPGVRGCAIPSNTLTFEQKDRIRGLLMSICLIRRPTTRRPPGGWPSSADAVGHLRRAVESSQPGTQLTDSEPFPTKSQWRHGDRVPSRLP